MRPKEVCNGGVACSLLKLDGAPQARWWPHPLLQNSLMRPTQENNSFLDKINTFYYKRRV